MRLHPHGEAPPFQIYFPWKKINSTLWTEETPWEERLGRLWVFLNKNAFFGGQFYLLPLEAKVGTQLQVKERFILLIFDPWGSNYWDPSVTKQTTHPADKQQSHTPNVSSVHREVIAHQDPPSSKSRADKHKKEIKNWFFLTEQKKKETRKVGIGKKKKKERTGSLSPKTRG